MSCDTSPQTMSSPPIKFHTAAFACPSPSCRKRKRESEGDEVRPHNLRSHQKFLAQNEGIHNYMPETISAKDDRGLNSDPLPPITCSPQSMKRTRGPEDEDYLNTFQLSKRHLSKNEGINNYMPETISAKDDKGLKSDPLPPITCPPQSMKRTKGPEDEDYLNTFQSSKRYLSKMMTSGLNELNVKDFSVGNLMESPASLESICNKSDDDLGAEVSRNSDSPHHLTTSEETISYSKSPSRSHAHQSDSKPDTLQVPRSPSDRCQNRNLRRTALLRSVKMHDHHSSHCVLPFGRDEENEAYVVRTSQDNSTSAAAARSRLCIETLDGFLSQKCHL